MTEVTLLEIILLIFLNIKTWDSQFSNPRFNVKSQVRLLLFAPEANVVFRKASEALW